MSNRVPLVVHSAPVHERIRFAEAPSSRNSKSPMHAPKVMHALIRTVSRSLSSCELLHAPRQEINIWIARQQHADYASALRTAGVQVVLLPEEPDFPDAAFVEDTAVVLDEVAVICRLGKPSREAEAARIEAQVESVRGVRRIIAPGTLEGGDVLRIGRKLFVGLSSRTNLEGIRQLQEIVAPLGYSVIPVRLNQCLHLKTAVTAPGEGLLIANPAWVDLSAFREFHVLEVPASEPWGANTLAVNGVVMVADSSPRTAELLEKNGLNVQRLGISELQKAEAGLTCLSLLFPQPLEKPGAL